MYHKCTIMHIQEQKSKTTKNIESVIESVIYNLELWKAEKNNYLEEMLG